MNSLSELVSDVVLRISDFDLGLLGLPSTEFILSVAEGLRTGLARSKQRDRGSLSPYLLSLLLVSLSPSPCLLVWFFFPSLSPSPSDTRPSILDPPRRPPPLRIGLRSNRQGFAFSIEDLNGHHRGAARLIANPPIGGVLNLADDQCGMAIKLKQ